MAEARTAEIADLGGGVHRVTQPLPWKLDHVHCYAIEDPSGWTLIDCGLGTRGTEARWIEVLRELGSPRIHRLVITHYHPDHLGGSALLAAICEPAEVVQGSLDRVLTEGAWLDPTSGTWACRNRSSAPHSPTPTSGAIGESLPSSRSV